MLSLEPFIQSNHQINLLRFSYELLRFITLDSKSASIISQEVFVAYEDTWMRKGTKSTCVHVLLAKPITD